MDERNYIVVVGSVTVTQYTPARDELRRKRPLIKRIPEEMLESTEVVEQIFVELCFNNPISEAAQRFLAENPDLEANNRDQYSAASFVRTFWGVEPSQVLALVLYSDVWLEGPELLDVSTFSHLRTIWAIQSNGRAEVVFERE